MTDERINSRAGNLLPEEKTALPADPEAMAEAILAESDERQENPAETMQEQRTSAEAAD
jgi:hypothetical protein